METILITRKHIYFMINCDRLSTILSASELTAYNSTHSVTAARHGTLTTSATGLAAKYR